MHALLLENQGARERVDLVDYARRLGLDEDAFVEHLVDAIEAALADSG